MKILIIITIILLLLIIIFLVNEFIKEGFFFGIKQTLLHKKLYDLVDKIVDLFDKNKITYFIHSGSLLGAVREKGIIPHDDDIDLGIFPEGNEILKSLEFKKELDKLNLKLTINKNNIHKIKQKNSKVFIDIFVFHEINDKIKYQSDYCNKNWPAGWFHKKDFFPLKSYKFGKMILQGPQNPIPYLNQHFGLDWEIPKITHSHHDNIKEEDI